jgi:hypothetical protein
LGLIQEEGGQDKEDKLPTQGGLQVLGCDGSVQVKLIFVALQKFNVPKAKLQPSLQE